MKIWVMALEPIESRYTCQWYHGLPELLDEEAQRRRTSVLVLNVEGDQVSEETTTGAFLNFADTNIWKNSQVNTVAKAFSDGVKSKVGNAHRVEPGDKFLFADAWNPGIIQVKYMSELLDIPVEIYAIWHAGSYDPQDFLGRKIKDKRWSKNFEESLFHCIDYNFFATEFHARLFDQNINPEVYSEDNGKIVISGQPHNKLVEQLKGYKELEKRNLILFPHRIAPEKQIDIFRDLAKSIPEYEWVVCQEKKLSKQEYHTLLGESKMVFSANLQETLGIGAMEAVLVDSIPFVPDRLSYSEMYEDSLKYPSKWTENWNSYLEHKDSIIKEVRNKIENYDYYRTILKNNQRPKLEKYLHPGPMLDLLFDDRSKKNNKV